MANTNVLRATIGAKKVKANIEGKSHTIKDHDKLNNLSFEKSGHTGFAGIKFGTTAEWDVQPEYCPLKGTLIVYTDYQVVIDPETSEATTIPNIKIGDGETSLINLPFVSGGILYCGITSTALYDGSNTNPIIINGLSYTAKKGDLVIVDRSAVAVQYAIETSYEANTYIVNDNKYYITNAAISSDENVSFASIKNKLDILKTNPQFLFDGAAWNILGSVAENFEVIKKVATIDDIPDDELGLYRFTEEKDGIVQSSHIYENVKENHGAEEVVFEKITDTNNTNLTVSTFFDQFNPSLIGLMSMSSADKIYALRYAYEGSTVENGIRFGTSSSAGSITVTVQTNCDITFKKYYSYNGSTGEVISYDENSKVIIDENEYSFEGDNVPLTINLAAGTHTISSYHSEDSSTRGRIILSLFEFQGEPYSIYKKYALARVEEVEEVKEDLNEHKESSNTRFVRDEQAIEKNKTDIVDINNRMGDIQAFQLYRQLPQPGEQFLYKVFRLNNKFYQCVKTDGELKEITFDKVTGTSEVTLSNVEGFITDLDQEDFSTYYYLDDGGTGWSKLFRNNGDIRLGSSSSTGAIKLFLQPHYIYDLPVTKLKVGVKAYNQKGSTVNFELNGDLSYVTDYNQFIDNADTETLIDLTSYLDDSDPLYLLRIETREDHDVDEETINNDKRIIITRIIAEFGTVEYEWKEIGGSGSSEGKDDNFVWTRIDLLKLKETENPINILITQKRKPCYHGVRVDTWKNKRGGSLLDINIQNLKDDEDVVLYEDILNAIFNLNFQRADSFEMQENDWDYNVWSHRTYKTNAFNIDTDCYSKYVYICDLGTYEDFISNNFYRDFFEDQQYMNAIADVFGNEDEGFYLDESSGHCGIKNKPIVIKFIKNPIMGDFQSYKGKICKNGLKISLTMVRPTEKISNIYLYAYVTPIILE